MKTILATVALFSAQLAFSYGWIQKADFGGVARHRTPILSIGNCIYTGQGHYNGGGINTLFDDWWQYDPSSNSWAQKADYPEGPVYHACGFVIGDFGYVGCGRTQPGGPGNPYVHETSFYKYDPATNSWSPIADLPGPGRRGGVAFAIDQYGFVGTGETGSGNVLNDFYRYNSTNNSWTQIASMPTAGRVSSVAFELNGFGYVGTGGVGSWSGSQNDFWQYNASTNQWTQKADVGPTNRMEASGFSLNGKGYILTGDNYSSGTNYSDMWEYEPTTNQWVQLDDFPGTARRYMASVAHNGVAYCGLGTSGTNFKDFWMFDQVMYIIEKNLEDISLNAWPNPSTEHIQIELKGLSKEVSDKISLKIQSMSGQEVYSGSFENNKAFINTTSFQKGMYLYSIVYNDQYLKSEQFMVQ